MTLQELIDRAVSIATRGIDPSASPALNSEMVAEDLIAEVFQDVSTKLASNPSTRSLLRRQETITFTNGVGTLPDEVLTEYMDESLLWASVQDPDTRYGWESQFSTFVRSSDQRFGWYCVNESTIYVIQPGATYQAQSGFNGNLNLIVPCALQVPATAADVITCRGEILDDLVIGLADALTAVPLQTTKSGVRH